MPDVLEPPQTTPSPSPSPAPQAQPSALDDFDKTFGDLDSAPAPNETQTETRATPSKDPATGKFTKAQPGVPEAGTASKPALPVEPKGTGDDAEKSDAVSKTGNEYEPPQVAKPSELRNYAKKMGSRAQAAETQLVQLNRRVKELESNPQHSQDTRALSEELVQTKKRLEEYEGELKVTRYERSGEYKDKYEKPYQNAYRSAYSDVSELLVSEPNPDDPENPRERQATPADFDEVYQLPLGPATKLAKAKFGDAYTEVLKHRSAIKGAAKAALEAINDHKGKAAEYEQQMTTQKTMQEEGRNRMFGEAVNAINQKYPELGEREKDTEWNQNLQKGRGMADLAFSDRKNLTPPQSAILDAQIHFRISAFPAIRAENTALKAEKAALLKEVAELRGSGPGKTEPGAPKTESEDSKLTMDQAFDKFVK